jgi:hypothetical protein
MNPDYTPYLDDTMSRLYGNIPYADTMKSLAKKHAKKMFENTLLRANPLQPSFGLPIGYGSSGNPQKKLKKYAKKYAKKYGTTGGEGAYTPEGMRMLRMLKDQKHFNPTKSKNEIRAEVENQMGFKLKDQYHPATSYRGVPIPEMGKGLVSARGEAMPKYVRMYKNYRKYKALKGMGAFRTDVQLEALKDIRARNKKWKVKNQWTKKYIPKDVRAKIRSRVYKKYGDAGVYRKRIQGVYPTIAPASAIAEIPQSTALSTNPEKVAAEGIIRSGVKHVSKVLKLRPAGGNVSTGLYTMHEGDKYKKQRDGPRTSFWRKVFSIARKQIPLFFDTPERAQEAADIFLEGIKKEYFGQMMDLEDKFISVGHYADPREIIAPFILHEAHLAGVPPAEVHPLIEAIPKTDTGGIGFIDTAVKILTHPMTKQLISKGLHWIMPKLTKKIRQFGKKHLGVKIPIAYKEPKVGMIEAPPSSTMAPVMPTLPANPTMALSPGATAATGMAGTSADAFVRGGKLSATQVYAYAKKT